MSVYLVLIWCFFFQLFCEYYIEILKFVNSLPNWEYIVIHNQQIIMFFFLYKGVLTFIKKHKCNLGRTWYFYWNTFFQIYMIWLSDTVIGLDQYIFVNKCSPLWKIKTFTKSKYCSWLTHIHPQNLILLSSSKINPHITDLVKKLIIQKPHYKYALTVW